MTLSLLTQTVTIGGLSYRVKSCLIDHALNGVPSVSFDVEMDANTGRPVPSVGLQFEVSQTCDGVYSVVGQLASVSRIRLSGGGLLFRVSGYGRARGAALLRRLGVVPEGPLPVTLAQVWAGTGVDLSLLPATGPTVPEFGMSYHSLSEYMEFVERQTGWAWSLSENTLRVWDPRKAAGNPFPPITLSSLDLEAGSINYSETLDGSAAVYNVARQQAWFRRSVTAQSPVVFDSRCISSVPLPRGAPAEAAGWEIEDAVVTRGTPLQGTLSEVEVRAGPDMIELTPPLSWNPPPRVRITYRRLVWVEEKDQASIDLYGRREGPPLYHDGDMGVEAAHQNLKQYLAGVSKPLVSLSATALRADLRPGQLVVLDVQEIGSPRTFIVRRVRRATSGTELEVQFSAETIGIDPDSLSGEPQLRAMSRTSTQETIRRVENLERGPLNPKNLSGKLAASVGPIPGPVSLRSSIGWSVTVEAEATGEIIAQAKVETTFAIGSQIEAKQPSSAVVQTSFAIGASAEGFSFLLNEALVETTIAWGSEVSGSGVNSALVETNMGLKASVEAEAVPVAEAVIQTTMTWSPSVQALSLVEPEPAALTAEEHDVVITLVNPSAEEDDVVLST